MTEQRAPWAGAVEKGSEAATELIKAARDLGGSIGPAFQQMFGMAEDQLTVWRAMRRARLARRYGDFMRQHGLERATREVAPAFLLPLIERASIETDDRLQDVWAAMLANAADANAAIEMRSAFVSMLGEMTHLDVVILEKLASASADETLRGLLPTQGLPERVAADESPRLPVGEVAVSLTNLSRLACIHPTSGMGGWLSFGLVTVTPLGRAFVAACTTPAPTGKTAEASGAEAGEKGAH